MIQSFQKWTKSIEGDIDESLNTAKVRFLDKKKITQQEFNDALSMDNTNSKKYIEKIIDLYLKSGKRTQDNLRRICSIFSQFEDLFKRNKIKKSDISSYKTIEELENAVIEAKDEEIIKESGKLVDGDFDIIVDNNDMLIVAPLNHKSSERWGKFTSWCTTSTNPTHWYRYINKDMSIYYIWIKNKDLIRNGNPNLDEYEIDKLSKIAIVVSSILPDEYVCWDKEDDMISIEQVISITGVNPKLFKPIKLEKPNWFYDIEKLELDANEINTNKDGSIDYDGNIFVYQPNDINASFNYVSGDWISANERNQKVFSMKDCSLPNEIGYDFAFNNTDIENLLGCPKIIGRDCDISNNPKLKSLEGAPERIGGDFNYKGTELSLSKDPNIRMTADDIRKIIKVKGMIINDDDISEINENLFSNYNSNRFGSNNQSKRILNFDMWKMSINESSTYNNMGFSFDDIMKIQSFLVSNNFMSNIRPNGKPSIDGMFGEESKSALIKYQSSKNLTPNGELNNETLSTMGLGSTISGNQTTAQTNIQTKVETQDIKPGVEKISRVLDRDGDYIEIIDPSTIKMVFEPGFKRYSASEWIEKGYKNFINLTYFEPNGQPTSNFFSNGVNLGAKLGELGYWPLMTLKPKLEIIEKGKDAISPIEGFSGSSVVVRNGQVVSKSLGPREAAVRQRTGVGITSSGDIIVYVTSKSNVNTLGSKMLSAGAFHAINVDGGGSSLFVRDGKVLFSTSREIPTILAW